MKATKLPNGCRVIDKTDDGKFIIGHVDAAFCPFEASTWTKAIEGARYRMGLDEVPPLGTRGSADTRNSLWDVLDK